MARDLLVDSRSGGLSASVDEDGFPILPPTLLTIHRTSARDEQTRSDPRRRPRPRGPPRRVECRVLAQDRRLELAQLGRRLDAQAVDERLVGQPVGLEGVGLASGAVEGQHLLAAQPFAERMLADERVELADDVCVPAAGEVGVDAVAEAGKAQVLELGDLGLGEARVGDLGERRATPQLEGPAQCRRRLPCLARIELGAALTDELGEAIGVEVAGRHAHRVGAALRQEHVRAERAAQARCHDVDGLPPVPRSLARKRICTLALGATKSDTWNSW